MDFLRFPNWGIGTGTALANRMDIAPSSSGYEDLDTVLQDARLRRDIARRPDLTPFVRDEPKAA
ncbi:hypothetical protein [Sphingobium nicotianae]|uniref:Uncharacterized protein n=1 Tax=Sphingobium nicotianae TaxID=2782607 RepID=A0A9X1DF40_9SPHN|nr:hypothetical protein [Sphingobium nicotianae]MBT2188749.1 hypothetical protein [Sphingobium nicotianae]